MPLPTVADVHVNTPLSQISVAHIQSATHFVADGVFPNIPVEKQSDRYYTYDRHYFNRDEMRERAPGTESAGGGYTVDATPTYYAPVYAFHHDVPDQRRNNADSVLAPDREATILATQKALIKREKTWATKYFALSIWTLDRVGVNSGPTGDQFLQWDDALSTPIEDVRLNVASILALTGIEPNTLVMGFEVWNILIEHPDIVDRLKAGQTPNGPAVVETSDLAKIFRIPRIFVMKSVETTSVEGAAADVSAFIGGKSALLVHAAPSAGLMTPSGGYTFSWTGQAGSGAAGSRISKFRMEHLKSDRVEIEMSFDQKLVSADLGVFYGTAVA